MTKFSETLFTYIRLYNFRRHLKYLVYGCYELDRVIFKEKYFCYHVVIGIKIKSNEIKEYIFIRYIVCICDLIYKSIALNIYTNRVTKSRKVCLDRHQNEEKYTYYYSYTRNKGILENAGI